LATNENNNWTAKKSADLYSLQSWGLGYFNVNDNGNVTVNPNRNGSTCEITDIIKSLHHRGVETPILLRFDGIVRDRVKRIQRAFYSAFDAFDYRAKYHLAYPIKVNQQSHVVNTVRTAGVEQPLTLEVGSKPELIAVLAIHDSPGALLLCNGYKDQEYIELALLASKLGRRPIIIIEQFYELELVLAASDKLNIPIELGIRMRPSVPAETRWADSAGERGKFGLTADRIIQVVERLKELGKDSWLKLLHFHVGSQLSTINSVKNALREATRVYVEIAKACPSLCLFDVGGGLAVDYDGSKTSNSTSMNYTEEEYARDIVYSLKEICDQECVHYPDIVSESGRATIAHHAVLVVEVTDVSTSLPATPTIDSPPTDTKLLADLYDMYNSLSETNFREYLNDSEDMRREVLEQFIRGEITLQERSYADLVLRRLKAKMYALGATFERMPEEIANYEQDLLDVYFCNFSVFQSIPDLWAIDQLFPIVPLQKLNEEPNRKAVIADLTCDSDGKVDCFIGKTEKEPYLRLHKLQENEPYYLGIFLVGAYQEILGDLHNLFGDTNAVHVSLDSQGQPEFTHVVEGDSVREVLEYVEFEPSDLIERLRGSVENAVKTGTLAESEARIIRQRYREALEGYTYLVK
jgi:arginine decarboxylase